MARRCANNYWLQLSDSIQRASDSGNVRGMYEEIKRATGRPVARTALLRSRSGELISNRTEQLNRWVEHYLDLYSNVNNVSQEALDAIENLPFLDALDAEPSVEELNKAIDILPCGKAAGEVGIPPEVIKSGKPALLGPLHELLCLCWREGQVPQDMRDAKIITLYKNIGDRSDCNNYRGISLLSIVGKVFARVVLGRLQALADRVYPESQCGFRAQRGTSDMIFSLRQLQEKCQPFSIKSGVKQGCVLAPTLFGIFFSLLLKFAFRDSTEGILLHTRSDGKLFNLARLRARTKVRAVLIRELLFADDAALSSQTEEDLQRLLGCFAHACREFGLTINIRITNVMGQDVVVPPSITIDGNQLEVAERFTYLGSTISNNLSLDSEIDKRIAKASSVMAKLNERVWSNRQLSLHTKLKVYHACVTSTLLYGSETWTTYAKQENRLDCFHLRCLHRILNITWEDRVTNTAVLEQAGTMSMHLLLCRRRLLWLGHVHRMQDGRIPKDLLYGELAAGARPTGRPALRFKDVCKRSLKTAFIDPQTWERLAVDRCSWRRAVREGVRRGEELRSRELEDKHRLRKARQQTRNNMVAPSDFICANCGRDCHARIGLASHSRRCRQRVVR
ncbi:uncharacterized protein LOC108676996 [Hyalella azteca]|uniref:Uncharacterized protein LOC108676996 n=1 Tax=Hyalella azteca TaxID=294128 RepID=A0A8B7P3Q7_HYAAZ|nr:uncharacterized protein LOC108676996 [Hyalella azteca]